MNVTSTRFHPYARKLGIKLKPADNGRCGFVEDGEDDNEGHNCILSGLICRPEKLTPYDLPVHCTVDQVSESALPFSRNNAFSPSFRISKCSSRRECVYYRRKKDTDPSEDFNTRTEQFNSDKDRNTWKLSEQAVLSSKIFKKGEPCDVPKASPQASRQHRVSVSFGATIPVNAENEKHEFPQVLFDSEFECGNLFKAERVVRQNPLNSAPPAASTASSDFKVQPLEEYLLYMEEEPNRRNGCQWFFFRTKLMNKRKRYSFSFCNFYKSKASFTKGMRPVFFSCIANALDKNIGWRRIGDDITYKKNSMPMVETNAGSAASLSQYSLSFTFEVPFDNDICYFAFSVPYSLSHLQTKIYEWMSDAQMSPHLEVYRMCRTVAGNTCPLLRITDNCSDYIPMHVLPWERERILEAEAQKLQESITRQREKDVRAREMAAQEEMKLEESRVFFVGKQKMHTSLGVLHWEQELDKEEDGINISTTKDPPSNLKNKSISRCSGDFSVSDYNYDCDMNSTAKAGSANVSTMCEPRSKKLKPVVVISARVHPGETVSSFMCEGLIRYLLSDVPSAILLRERCVFLIVPMLNPDGVVNGFYRTNLCGTDLNRCWDKPSEIHHPTVHALKGIISDLQKTDRVIQYFDFHGHSHKKGIFFYGTRMYPSYTSVYNQVVHGIYDSPYASISKDSNKIGAGSCNFFDGQNKKGSYSSPSALLSAWKPFQSISPVEFVLSVGSATRLVNLRHCTAAFPRVARYHGVARYVVSEELEVPVSFTVEASFHCGVHGPYKKRHFRSDDYYRFGHILGFTIYKMNFENISGPGNPKTLPDDKPDRSEWRKILCGNMCMSSHMLFIDPGFNLANKHTQETTDVIAASSLLLNEEKLCGSSDNDDDFKEYLKLNANPFKTRWYASISNTTAGTPCEEQDDSDDDAEGRDLNHIDDMSEMDTKRSRGLPQNRFLHIRYFQMASPENDMCRDENSDLLEVCTGFDEISEEKCKLNAKIVCSNGDMTGKSCNVNNCQDKRANDSIEESDSAAIHSCIKDPVPTIENSSCFSYIPYCVEAAPFMKQNTKDDRFGIYDSCADVCESFLDQEYSVDNCQNNELSTPATCDENLVAIPRGVSETEKPNSSITNESPLLQIISAQVFREHALSAPASAAKKGLLSVSSPSEIRRKTLCGSKPKPGPAFILAEDRHSSPFCDNSLMLKGTPFYDRIGQTGHLPTAVHDSCKINQGLVTEGTASQSGIDFREEDSSLQKLLNVESYQMPFFPSKSKISCRPQAERDGIVNRESSTTEGIGNHTSSETDNESLIVEAKIKDRQRGVAHNYPCSDEIDVQSFSLLRLNNIEFENPIDVSNDDVMIDVKDDVKDNVMDDKFSVPNKPEQSAFSRHIMGLITKKKTQRAVPSQNGSEVSLFAKNKTVVFDFRPATASSAAVSPNIKNRVKRPLVAQKSLRTGDNQSAHDRSAVFFAPVAPSAVHSIPSCTSSSLRPARLHHHLPLSKGKNINLEVTNVEHSFATRGVKQERTLGSSCSRPEREANYLDAEPFYNVRPASQMVDAIPLFLEPLQKNPNPHVSRPLPMSAESNCNIVSDISDTKNRLIDTSGQFNLDATMLPETLGKSEMVCGQHSLVSNPTISGSHCCDVKAEVARSGHGDDVYTGERDIKPPTICVSVGTKIIAPRCRSIEESALDVEIDEIVQRCGKDEKAQIIYQKDPNDTISTVRDSVISQGGADLGGEFTSVEENIIRVVVDSTKSIETSAFLVEPQPSKTMENPLQVQQAHPRGKRPGRKITMKKSSHDTNDSNIKKMQNSVDVSSQNNLDIMVVRNENKALEHCDSDEVIVAAVSEDISSDKRITELPQKDRKTATRLRMSRFLWNQTD